MYYKRSQLDALIEALRKRRRFISPAGLFVYVAGALLLLIILFPGEQVHSLIRSNPAHDAFSLKYFENQLAAQPGDTAVRLALARTYARYHDIEKLQSIIPPLLDSGTAAIRREAAFFEVIIDLHHAEDRYRESPEELRREILRRIAAVGPIESLTSHANLMFHAEQAVRRGALLAGVQLYLLGMDLAPDDPSRHNAFLKAVGVMEQTGRPYAALRLAELYASRVRLDQESALYLMNLARRAERIDIARKYALFLWSLESHDPR